MVDKLGTLRGYGHGCPPCWISSAPAAEAWALRTVLSLATMMPSIRTDCFTLVSMARLGAELAMAANKPLAAIWRDIAHYCDGQVSRLVDDELLVWLPAH